LAFWDNASASLATQASGPVTAVLGDLRPRNTWQRIELPLLENNPKVTQITTIDAYTGQPTIVFKR
jgi:hypothetical protein